MSHPKCCERAERYQAVGCGEGMAISGGAGALPEHWLDKLALWPRIHCKAGGLFNDGLSR